LYENSIVLRERGFYISKNQSKGFRLVITLHY